jgi:Tfp pilus assembly protein PilN
MAVPARRVRTIPRRPRLVPVEPSRRISPRRRGRSRSVRSVPFAIFALLVTAVMVTALVAAQALVAQGSFRLAELTREARALEDQTGFLQARAAELSDLARVKAAARRTGLVDPQHVELLVVGEGRG